MLTACAACSRSPPVSEPAERTLPEEPAFARPVGVRPLQVGDDLLAVAARERAGRAKANDIIICFVDWYAGLKAVYGRTVAEKQAGQSMKVCEELQAKK